MSERPQMDEFTFGSLFAGIGGFDLGFERAGMRCDYQVEVDGRCNEVLAHHWPAVERFGDVRDVGKRNLESVDLICGGFPCQGLSVAGRRAGLADERSGLWWEFYRVVEELCPRWVVIENVPGLLSSSGGRDMGTIIGALAELGFGWAYRSFDAQYDRVAQRRRRVFIVGYSGDVGGLEFSPSRQDVSGLASLPVKVLFEPESVSWGTAPLRGEREKVTAPIKAGTPSRRGGGSWPIAEEFIVQHALSAHNQRNDPDGEHFVIARPLAHGETLNHYDESQQTYVIEAIDVRNLKGQGDISGTLQAKENGYSLNYTNPIAFAWQQGVSPNDRSYPIRAGDYAGSLSSTRHDAVFDRRVGVRRLTPLECERLQGFPDGWTAVNGMKDSPRYRMLGNAVCVPVAEWIGRRIMATEEAIQHRLEFAG